MKHENQENRPKRTAQFVSDYREEQPAVIIPQNQAGQPQEPTPSPEPPDENVPTIRVTLEDAALLKEPEPIRQEEITPPNEEELPPQQEMGFPLWKRNNQPSKLYYPENPALLEEQDDETAQNPEAKIRGVIPGVLLLLAAFTGVVCFCMFGGVNLVQDSTQLNTFLAPVMMQNPQPFSAVTQANSDMTLQASVWRAVTLHSATYQTLDDQGKLIVPMADVAKASKELFGSTYQLPSYQPTAQTFFTYDVATDTFRVLPQSSVTAATPQITNIFSSFCDFLSSILIF